MGTTVQRSIIVRRPADEVAAIVTDPRVVLPVIGGLGRFQELTTDAEGLGEWDVFLDIGSVHVGGRVVVERPGPRQLAWHAIRGTRHQLELTVHEHGADTQVTIAMSLQLAGLVLGRVAETLARGIMVRHIDAGLQQLRHHVEFEG
ncbi:MAG TPA: SRPBCC family protein [Aeromicrobium sp.]|nr:SRPBCC family protein [Aeromicrobium sp.]